MPNIIAIVGRPNVGQVNTFQQAGQKPPGYRRRNRRRDPRTAITESRTGTGSSFLLSIQAGYVEGSDDIFEEEIRRQVELAIGEADIIMFVVDVKDGMTSMDKDVALLLRKSRKKNIPGGKQGG